jgi:hypothetical protein
MFGRPPGLSRDSRFCRSMAAFIARSPGLFRDEGGLDAKKGVKDSVIDHTELSPLAARIHRHELREISCRAQDMSSDPDKCSETAERGLIRSGQYRLKNSYVTVPQAWPNS